MHENEVEIQPSSGIERPKPSKQRRPKAPQTDETVRAQLARAIGKSCRSLGEGALVKVSLLVGSDGSISNKLVHGATGALERCVLKEVAKGSFPTGAMRKVSIDVSL